MRPGDHRAPQLPPGESTARVAPWRRRRAGATSEPGPATPPARRAARTGPAPAASSGTVLVAVVHAADGVRLAVAAASRAELVRRLAEYVRRRGRYVLLPDHARHLGSLLARGELEAAVEAYFGRVGQRWGEEWLVTAAVPTDGRAETLVSVGAIAPPPGRLVEPPRSPDTR